MEIRSIDGKVELLGYANVPGKLSKKLRDNRGQFVEKIEEGAFQRSLENNPKIPLLLNHDRNRIIAEGDSVEIQEDNIGLKVRAIITDNDVIKALKQNKASGFSFGFYANEQEYSSDIDGVETRTIKDLTLTEVSLLVGKTPAYNNTSVVEVRDDGSEELIEYRSVDNITIDIQEETQETEEETREDNSKQIEYYKHFIEMQSLYRKGL